MGCWFFTCVCGGGVLLLPKSHLIICLVNEVEHLWSPQQRTSCQSRTGSWFRETPGPPGSELQVLEDLSSLQREHISPNSLAEIAPADGISASLLTLDEDQTPVVRALQTHWAAVKWNKKDFFLSPMKVNSQVPSSEAFEGTMYETLGGNILFSLSFTKIL